MIYQIKGELIEKTPSFVVVDCNGVGYLIQISLTTYAKIAELKEAKLYTSYMVSVDVRSGASNHTLYGFYEREEQNLFLLLQSVSGVSANTARMMLSSLNPDEIRRAITEGDEKMIKTIKGIGPKLAQRIITELNEKVKKEEITSPTISSSSNNNFKKEALSALLALGFDRISSSRVLDKILSNTKEEMPVDKLIKEALKHF